MATTKITSEREAIRVGDTQYFKVYVSCTDGGDLPDTYPFVKKIVSPGDPQQDVFTRIVEIVDLDEITASRNVALSNGDTYFRDSAFSKLYTDLEVATAAVQAIRDRLNTLTTDYVAYDEDFVTTGAGEDSEYPSSSPTAIQELKDDYSTARTAYLAVWDQVPALEAAYAAGTEKVQLYSEVSIAYSTWLERLGDLKGTTDIVKVTWDNYPGLLPAILTGIDLFMNNYTSLFEYYQAATVSVPLDVGTWTNLSESDLGLSVSQQAPGTSTGKLIAYDNTNHTVLVNPTDPVASNDFINPSAPGSIGFTIGGTTTYTQTDDGGMITPLGSFGPNIQDLKARRDLLFTQAQTLESANAKYTATGYTSLLLMISDFTAATLEWETKAQEAAQELGSIYEQVAEITADAATAYEAVQSAYEAVKEVCPNWSPSADEVFPPAPELKFGA